MAIPGHNYSHIELLHHSLPAEAQPQHRIVDHMIAATVMPGLCFAARQPSASEVARGQLNAEKAAAEVARRKAAQGSKPPQGNTTSR